MSSVTEGARLEALAQIGDLGADTLIVRGTVGGTGGTVTRGGIDIAEGKEVDVAAGGQRLDVGMAHPVDADDRDADPIVCSTDAGVRVKAGHYRD